MAQNAILSQKIETIAVVWITAGMGSAVICCFPIRRAKSSGGQAMNQSAVAIKKSRVFLVDDHPIVRQGLALLINREMDLTVCGEAGDAQSAMQSVTTVKPDILLVDISLNGPDGLDLLKDVRTRCPDLPG